MTKPMEATLDDTMQRAERHRWDGLSANELNWRLLWQYVEGALIATFVTLFVAFLGLEFTARQWIWIGVGVPIWAGIVIAVDFYVIRRNTRPVGRVLEELSHQVDPSSTATYEAINRALNLPLLSFVRVTYIHGPTAVVAIVAYMLLLNRIGDTAYSAWQITVFCLTALILAAPIHAIYEYFGINRHLSPLIRSLWEHAGRPVSPPIRPVSIKLRSKLIYLAVFTSSVPLIFFAVTIVFRVELLFEDLGIVVSFAEIWPLLAWIGGVVAVFLGSGITVSLLTARELSSSASRLIRAMDRVERSDLDNYVHVTGTDEFADLFRGFNLMTDSLREEVQILEMSHDLAGELNLEVLLTRIMRATTELLSADRSTLFLHDRTSGELWSRVAEGIATKEIRIPGDAGIAGAAFTSGRTENITDPYSDPRFNRTVDQETGYRTESILCMPIFNNRDSGLASRRCSTNMGVRSQPKTRAGSAHSMPKSRWRWKTPNSSKMSCERKITTTRFYRASATGSSRSTGKTTS